MVNKENRKKQRQQRDHQEAEAVPKSIGGGNGQEGQTKNDGSAEHQTQHEVAGMPQQRERFTERLPKWTDKWNSVLQVIVPSILSLMILSAIIVQAVIYHWQWRSMQASIEETQKNRELEYRAYVGAKGALYVPRSDNPAYGNVILVSVNTGRTGVRELKIRKALEPRDSSPPDTTEVKDDGSGLTSKIAYLPNIEYRSYMGVIETQLADILRAQQTLAAQGISTAPAPTPQKKSANEPMGNQGPVASLSVPPMPEFGKGYYLYGVIEYKDIFSKLHSTRFCFFIPPKSSEFLACPTFNDAN